MGMTPNSIRNRLRVLDIPMLEKILDSKIGIGISIIDDELRLMWTNSTFNKWFGSRSKLHGVCSSIHRSLEKSCPNCPAILTFQTGKIQYREQSAITGWGEEKLYRFTTVPLRDTRGVVVRAMELIEDMTHLSTKQVAPDTSKHDQEPSLLAIFSLDQEGNIISTNPEHLRIAQAPPENVIGLNWLKVAKSKELGLSDHLIRGLNGQPFELHNFRYSTYKGDKEIYIDLIGVPLQRPGGKIEGLLCIMQDRTEETGRVINDCPIIGESPTIKAVKQMIVRVAPHACPVLIQGESGTGKELVAQEIHRKSRRAGNPFVAVNGAAFQDNLLASELFGHTKGAFTGADQNKKGLFELAHNGTFFLDEIGDISPAMQVKLLRVLETGTFRPVGDVKEVKVNVRFIAATNRNLKNEVKLGNFREDLYYRLNVVSISLPSLRERVEDIPLLVDHFLSRTERTGQKAKKFSPDALKDMMKYFWPGNIRELSNVVERSVLIAQDEEIVAADLLLPGMGIREHLPQIPGLSSDGESLKSLAEFMDQVEQRYILEIMAKAGGNKEKAAALLDISLRSLYRKIDKYGILVH